MGRYRKCVVLWEDVEGSASGGATESRCIEALQHGGRESEGAAVRKPDVVFDDILTAVEPVDEKGGAAIGDGEVAGQAIEPAPTRTGGKRFER